MAAQLPLTRCLFTPGVRLLLLLLQGGKLFLIIVYPNSRNTEVRARCCIRGVPQLAAANRLDLEELLSFDRETGSSSSMLVSSGECSWWWVGGGVRVLGCAGRQGKQKQLRMLVVVCAPGTHPGREEGGGFLRARTRVPRAQEALPP